MFSSSVILQSVVGGLMNGGIYALVAVGLTLIFGVMRVINFAHGEFLMLAMYMAFFGWATLGIDPYWMMLLAPLALALLGMLFFQYLTRYAMGAPEINQMAITLGASLLLQNAALLAFKGDNQIISLSRATDSIALGVVTLQIPQLAAAAVSVVLMGGLYLLLTRTDLGLMMRATAQSSEGAALSGIDLSRVYRWAMALGVATLGFAGPLILPTMYVNPGIGALFTLKAFVIVIAGGLGSVPGALLGGLLVGLTESVAGVWLPGAAASAIPFAFLVVVMIWRPQGLLKSGGRR
ncbi:MAG: branched-chain amino acid ABC transporter permease [Pseudomonadota bacterium]